MSRDGSPDWLTSFQVPKTESVLSLSSDSVSSLNGLGSGEDTANGYRQASAHKSSGFDVDEDEEDLYTISGKRIGGSSLGKRSNGGNSLEQEGKVEDLTPQEKKKSEGSKKSKDKSKAIAEKSSNREELNDSVVALSSDSDPENSPPKEEDGESSDLKLSQLLSGGNSEDVALMGSSEESPSKQASKGKSPKKRPKGKGKSPKKEKKTTDIKEEERTCEDVEVADKEAADKQTEPSVSSSTLPLVLSDKVQRTKALVECEKDSIDLSGDMGAVGRVIVSDSRSGQKEMCLDLKGTIYKTTIVPSRTFCVVSFGPSEAKIEAIMNDFIQLKPETHEAETMVEGTLDGFLFDSEDEANKVPKAMSQQTDKDEDTEEQTNGTAKGKGKADKSKAVKKRDKPSSGGKPQPPKKARKKTQVSKKPKSKK